MVGVRRQLTLIVLGIAAPIFSLAQVDSLEAVLRSAESDSIRVRAHVALSEAYQYSNSSKAKSHGQAALDIANREQWSWALYEAYKQQAFLSAIAGDYTTALKYDND